VRPQILESAAHIDDRFPATRKNSSGYALDHYLASGDVLDLIIGSEGTLGFVSRVELTLEAIPRGLGSALVSLPDIDALPEIVHRLTELDPAALEFLDRSLLELGVSHLPFA
jgi:FAD/FMN-containing dehydrogenase